MTKILIHPGACGMQVTVAVQNMDKKTFSVTITSECEMVGKLAKEITELTLMDAYKSLLNNPVYTKGASCLRHVSCPVPCGILKALEVEAGLNVPKDCVIHFVKDEEEKVP
jgi:hypothetical protein